MVQCEIGSLHTEANFKRTDEKISDLFELIIKSSYLSSNSTKFKLKFELNS